MGTIISLNISITKGTGKKPVEAFEVRPDHGVVGDAHAGDWHRQISLLGLESFQKMKNAAALNLQPGAFAENITTQGMDLVSLPVGTRLISNDVELEVTQIGKKCHSGCNIAQKVGDCVMPKEGIFAKVIVGGTLHAGASIEVKNK